MCKFFIKCWILRTGEVNSKQWRQATSSPLTDAWVQATAALSLFEISTQCGSNSNSLLTTHTMSETAKPKVAEGVKKDLEKGVKRSADVSLGFIYRALC